jgi:hypothetical protein
MEKPGLSSGEILRRVLRNPRFWMVSATVLTAAVVTRLLVDGWVGETISDVSFLGLALWGGTMARAAAGLPPRR